MIKLLPFLLVSFGFYPVDPSPTLQEMQEDFDILRNAIEEVHGGIYRHSNKAWVDNHFRNERAKLASVDSKYGFIAVVSETLAGLRDGHLRLEYDSQTTSALSTAKLLPLTIALEGGKAIVVLPPMLSARFSGRLLEQKARVSRA